jgi:hypothetical protein
VAVDLYAGSLTRYYLGNWENVGQAWARQNGIPYQVVRPDAAPGGEEGESEGPDPEDVRTAICEWRGIMSSGLGENLNVPLDWDEDPASPYFTDRPHWDGYAGLLLLAAHEERPELDPPKVVGSDWRDDLAYAAALEEDFNNTEYLHVLAPELWLPCEFPFTFKFMDLTGHEMYIGSLPRLLEQLEMLNERTYRGDVEARLKWRSAAPQPGGPFAAAACYGLSVFLDLAEQAIAHRLPLKLDY